MHSAAIEGEAAGAVALQETVGALQARASHLAPQRTRGIGGWLRWRLQDVLDWLYPVYCLKCGCSLLGRHSPGLCPRCETAIIPLSGTLCRRCGSLLRPDTPVNGQEAGFAAQALLLAARTGDPLPEAGAEEAECEALERNACCPHCAGAGARYTRAAGAVRYLSPARDLVHDFKYNGNCALADFFAPQMVQGLRRAGLPEAYDLIVPVPLHRRRLRMRGYNQSLLLARGVARQIAGELRPGVLQRVRFTQAQALTAPAERVRNIAGAFAVRGRIAGASVLLIDDVMTTGATVNECAQELRKAGAQRVYVLVWAR